MGYLFLTIAILSEVAGTAALKASAEFTRPIPSLIVVAGYATAFVCLSLTLRTIPVGIAYAIWAGLGIVLVTAIAWILHGQKLDAWAWVGMGLIVSGVAVLNLLSRSGTAH
jgi:multidrug transporter EmrE-like cation transporter